MQTYAHDPFWRRLQPHLPPQNRLRAGNLPREQFLRMGRFRIHLDVYHRAKPKARLLLLHGVGGNGRLLSFIALPLWRAGYEVICPDLPLYGCTQTGGGVTYGDWVDVAAGLALYCQRGGVPTLLFGLSAGGMLAYQAACRCKGVRGVIATCLLDQRDATVTRATAIHPLMARLGMPLVAAVRGPLGGVTLPMKLVANMRAIANSPRVARLLMGDTKSSGARVSLDFLHSMLHPAITPEPEAFDRCPVLLAHPGRDNWTPLALSQKFYDRLACPKQLCILPGAGHFPLEAQGLKALERACLRFIPACL